MARSRSQQAHERVLRAALDLFSARGIDATSMDAISQTSGVSKATIYNHWANKEALLMDAMMLIHGVNRDPEDVDSGDVRGDLITVLHRRPPDEYDAVRDRLMPAMVAYSATHREFGDAWRHRVMEPGRVLLKRILRRGMERKLLPSSLDLEAAMALLLGPLLYLKIFRGECPTKDMETRIVDSFWQSHAISGAPAPTRAPRRRTATK
ncbi:MAG TPA: TetR/AcrR family transcriptional regulator [Bryobacteraceae bacterium]|jgi:AcrR family transcriptional regulator|nr:TetR/AcrR family transcriptional regulator [Bryobacteraceae bacterium]